MNRILVPWLALLFATSAAAQQTLEPFEPMFRVELAGRRLNEFPFFTPVAAVNEGAGVVVWIDTRGYRRRTGRTADVYVLPHRSVTQWQTDRVLVDVHGSPLRVQLHPGGGPDNLHLLDAGTLSGHTGTTELGVGYDVVVDYDKNGMLDRTDAIDGWGDEAGFYVMPDLVQTGPYESTEVLYNGGGWLLQDIYYPTNVASLGQLPLIVVSHGNGHNYRWYDHIGNFMASWGYVVMSHRNNTGPGIQTASTTTLSNTNHFLANLDVIAGGVLDGHVDSSRMTWMGHSRGGEGVVRAYDRLVEGDPIATEYTAADVRLISSIAPTVFLGPTQSDPHDATYHLWTGGADADVDGCANCNICQTFHLHERAEGTRMSISLHGAGHGDFHAGGGSSVANGPCRLGRGRTHRIMRGHLLPLVKHVIEGNVPAKDYLWRQWEELRPIGAPESECVVVDLMYQQEPRERRVIDDFQSNLEPGLSSSGGAVVHSFFDLVEDRMDDLNRHFDPRPADPMNGMTLAGPGEDTRGIVFEWGEGEEFLMFEVPPPHRDVTGYRYLSFRAAQSTRDVLTEVVLGDLTFDVQLTDGRGRSSTINIGAYSGGIEQPYRRPGCGSGRGWANEFETIRIRLADFAAMGARIDLRDVVAVTFLFGPGHGSIEGRIGLDAIEFAL